ncbi:Protein of unknown function DUF4817 [Cinara cedri]|uniref:Uncharacterized protein n=1 Tax=Cinara cedri TaxID=506608 RepID=A0A5E4MAP0_9HEMI|nr:Protein of unknown function DUF4817 [Cinara cedri]
MVRFIVEQRVTIVKMHSKCRDCVAETLQKFRTKQCAIASDCNSFVRTIRENWLSCRHESYPSEDHSIASKRSHSARQCSSESA